MATIEIPPRLRWVNDIDGERVWVYSPERGHNSLLKDLGGRKPWLSKYWDIAYSSDEQLAKILTSLRDAGFAFLGEPSGWPPTEIFEDLRKRGLLNGPYREITWLGPGRPILLDHSADGSVLEPG